MSRGSFRVATYNVLATAYIKPDYYPFTPAYLLDSRVRSGALAAHVANLHADLICLQEVEVEMFDSLSESLIPLGYRGALTSKAGGKPDGCATFARHEQLEWVELVRVEYDDASDGLPRSGHIAQLVVLSQSGRRLGVANTHLKWDPPSTPLQRRYGYRQITQLLATRHAFAPPCDAWIICGDFNVTADNEVIRHLQGSGFQSTHGFAPALATCNSNGRAKLIDYLFHDDGLEATAVALPSISDDTPLPGPDQPSDHVAVLADLRLRTNKPMPH